jgi:PAS domain S-box-containing protein
LGLWQADLASGRVFLDGGSAGLLRYPVSAGVIETTWSELVHPEDQPQIQAAMDTLRADADAQIRVEHRMRRADGVWVWVETRGAMACAGPAPEPDRVAGTYADIGERRAAERVTSVRDSVLEAIAFMAHCCLHGGGLAPETSHAMLGRLGRALDLDRVALVPFADSSRHGGFLAACEWRQGDCRHGTPEAIIASERWARVLREDRALHGNSRDFPAAESSRLLANGVHSIAIVPVLAGRECLGALVFEDHRAEREWAGSITDALRTAGSLLGGQVLRARGEAEVREGRERYHAIYRSANVGIAILARDGAFQQVNDFWVSLLGYDRQSLAGMRHADLLHPEDAGAARGAVGSLVKGERDGFRDEYRYVRADGQTLHADASASVIRDSDGTVQAICLVISDTTQRRVAERALRASEGLLRRVLDLVPHFIYVKDDRGRFVVANEAIAQFYGTTASDLVGRRHADVHPARDEVEAVASSEAEVLERMELMPFQEETVHDADGVARVLLTTRLPYSEPNLRGVLAVSLDVTELKRAERALRESEWRLRLALDATSDGVWDYDLTTGVLCWAPRWLAALGYPTEGAKSTLSDRLELLHPDDRAKVTESLDRVAAGEAELHQVDYRVRTGAGGWTWVRSRGKVVARDADGRATRMLGTHADVTAAKQAENVTERNRRRLSILLSLYEMRDAPEKEILTFALRACMEITDSERAFMRMPPNGSPGPATQWLSRCLEGHGMDPGPLDRFVTIPIDPEAPSAPRGGLADKADPYTEEEIGEARVILRTAWNMVREKREERALSLMRFSLDHVSVPGLWIWADGSVAYANDAASELLSGHAGSLVGSRAWDIGLAAGEEDWDRWWQASLAEGRSRMELATPDAPRAFEVVSSHIELGGDAYVVVFLHEAPKDLADPFAYPLDAPADTDSSAHLGHDLNNLLLTILGNASVALEQMPAVSPARQRVAEIEDAACRAADLATELMGVLEGQLKDTRQPSAASSAPDGDEALVLVAEDDEGVRSVVSSVLQAAGYAVVAAENGAEAVRVFKEMADRLDGCVIDLVMPEMSGDEALRLMREHRPELPAVISSGYRARFQVESLLASSHTEFLQKPYRPRVLIDTIARLLRDGGRARGRNGGGA